ncbi:MAG: carbohydrate ABC transporter permease [Oscillospiraceae bacterium]|jgi:putative aldouronate transport system permease protein|nr:carbohydrate ABC transporter permease [Oscillospiraceae bacterium]MCI1990917.1 carbohydrate ABC transporter permease [Oscillospiraceae bacterium]MCI2036144.1 carbohydrate ABC transporter permease [Oscillospiraceae bacterium]
MKKSAYQTGLEKFNRIHPATNFVFNLVFILLSLVCVVPILLVLSISLTSEQTINSVGYQFIPQSVSFESYIFLWKQYVVLFRAFGVSIFVTVVGTVLGVLLTTSMGYVLSRPQYRLKKFLTWVVFIPMVFNGGMVSSYFVNTNFLGLKNNIWALVLPLMVSSFNVIVCKTFFQSTIPDSIVESAKIDGATQLKIFFRIVLPISLPVLATIGLFLCFTYWNDWFQSMLYIDDSKLYSLQALLMQIMNNVDYLSRNAATMGISAAQVASGLPKEGMRMAIAVIIVLPIACAYPFFQKYFISGLTIGSVKG